MDLYVIKDGIKGIAFIADKNGNQITGTDYYALSYDFKTNEGYIEKKNQGFWRLYTQVGQKFKESRYHQFSDFEGCIKKLEELKGNNQIVFCDSKEIDNYK